MRTSLNNNDSFAFLAGDTLREIARIAVTVPDGTWDLSDSLLFNLETQGSFQIIVEVDGQDIIKLDTGVDVQIRGEYGDLIKYEVKSIEPPNITLPDRIVSIVEFKSASGKVIGLEIELTHSTFSVLLYPEDAEIRPAGAIWQFIREYGLPELSRVNVSRTTGAPITND
jgi:hypothetical protein